MCCVLLRDALAIVMNVSERCARIVLITQQAERLILHNLAASLASSLGNVESDLEGDVYPSSLNVSRLVEGEKRNPEVRISAAV